MTESYYSVHSSEVDVARLSRAPDAPHRAAMCPSCNAPRLDWWPRPFDVRLRNAPTVSGPCQSVMQCVIQIWREELLAVLGPLVPVATLGRVWADDHEGPVAGWRTVLLPREQWVNLHAGPRTQYERCGTCGFLRWARFDEPTHLVAAEVGDRPLFCAHSVTFVNRTLRDAILRQGIPGIEFQKTPVLERALDRVPMPPAPPLDHQP